MNDLTERPAAIHWFGSDLRLTDNAALFRAARGDTRIAPVFVRDPDSLRRSEDAHGRLAFLDDCLHTLDASLRRRGTRLLVLRGDPTQVLPRLAAALGATRVTRARNHEPAARLREARVAQALAQDGVAFERTEAGLVHAPARVLGDRERPFLVFGAFARAWNGLPLPPAHATPRCWVSAETLERLVPESGPRAAAACGRKRESTRQLDAFLNDAVAAYGGARDMLGRAGTSGLSAHLRFGTLSAAMAARRAAARAEADPASAHGVRAWVRQLAWRDFHGHILAGVTGAAWRGIRPLSIAWRDDAESFATWCRGETGYPLVDAGMRELAATGTMHNRARMVVASFLTRHLLLDWRLGARHFMRHLLDGQLAQNSGNWQWIAGCGADAQPFHRIFSPQRQGERFDAEGVYTRRWVPELARVAPAALHAPWTLTPTQRRSHCPDYPPPMVEHAAARARALAALRGATNRRRAEEVSSDTTRRRARLDRPRGVS